MQHQKCIFHQNSKYKAHQIDSSAREITGYAKTTFVVNVRLRPPSFASTAPESPKNQIHLFSLAQLNQMPNHAT